MLDGPRCRPLFERLEVVFKFHGMNIHGTKYFCQEKLFREIILYGR